MNSFDLYKAVFTYLKSDSSLSTIADIGVLHPDAGATLGKGMIVVSATRDAIAGKYISQAPTAPEIQLTLYHSNFAAIASAQSLDDLVHKAMLAFNYPANFHLVRRFFARWIAEVSLWQSSQIYRFYLAES